MVYPFNISIFAVFPDPGGLDKWRSTLVNGFLIQAVAP